MSQLKCKKCGGELNIIENSTICICEYCGSKETVPSIDDENKVRAYERANKLRVACDFDRAASVYESIVRDYGDEAEAFWGLVLCRYGIEYVDDPATGKKVPTCHRSSYNSVMRDSDFEMVMENAEEKSLEVYRENAKQIEDIRKGILEVSSKEDPYDIFICYKETDSYGNRTVDSVMAQNIYEILTQRGYRVFFSRISLEDKIGEEYEPYIFAALNSAKIMLVFGTSYINYNAVWVKNEWSRYLKLMSKEKSKYLIPCYKNIDAYDIPKEFQHLQAQDMGKVGAEQDLLRGIEKILKNSEVKKAASENAMDKESVDSAIADAIKKTEQKAKCGTIATSINDTNSLNKLKALLEELEELKNDGYMEAEREINNCNLKIENIKNKKRNRNKLAKRAIGIACVVAVVFSVLWFLFLGEIVITKCELYRIKKSQTSDVVKYGKEEKEAKEWYVIYKDERGAMLLSKDIVCNMYYTKETNDFSWEKSEVRAYLNSSFYKQCFNSCEKKNVKKHNDDNVYILDIGDFANYVTNEMRLKEKTWLKPFEGASSKFVYANQKAHTSRVPIVEELGVRPVIFVEY